MKLPYEVSYSDKNLHAGILLMEKKYNGKVKSRWSPQIKEFDIKGIHLNFHLDVHLKK
jgi:hypothetical protein